MVYYAGEKFALTEETIEIGDRELHRIVALKSIKRYGVKPGDLGGFVERTDNLSHDGDCWVTKNAKVFEDAEVVGDALVTDNAVVLGKSSIAGYACISGKAYIIGKSVVDGRAKVKGNAVVNSAIVTEDATVKADAVVRGVTLCGHITVKRSANIDGDVTLLSSGTISRNMFITDKPL